MIRQRDAKKFPNKERAHMTTRQLYYLVTISDLGSLSGASQVLGISQPALSKFLTEYEESLGFLIFLRYHRQLTPTSVGRYVIGCAQKILDEQTRMIQAIRAVTGSGHTGIRLATAPNRGAIIYSQIYNQFSHRYPDISLSLTELYASSQPGAILHGQIDLAIGSGKISDKVTDLPIAYEELLVSLPVSHPLATAGRIRLSDLRDTPFVLQGQKHSIRILAEELFEEAGFNPVVTFESNDVILVDSMLHQAVGAGLVSQAHVFPCEELVYRSLDPPIHQTLHIRYPLGHTLTDPERYLAGLLAHERLSDPRYKPIPSPEVEELLRIVDQDQADADGTGPSAQAARAHAARRTAPEISLNTQLLKYIIAIVDEKSLTRAAEKFYLSQPALSRHLHNMEHMLCAQLFTRVHNRLQPTNAGKVFANFARNILQIESEMSGHIHTYQSGHGGGIYLQCDPCLVNFLENRVTGSFHALHPDVKLSVVESGRGRCQEALLNASADFGLYFSCKEEHPILDSRILDEDELVYCPGAQPLATQPPAPSSAPMQYLRLLPGHHQEAEGQIMLAQKDSALRMEQERIFSMLFEQPPAPVCEAQPDILHSLAQLGAADTILPARCLSREMPGRIISFEPRQNYYLLLVHHPGRRLPASANDLARLINDAFEAYFDSFV